MEVIKGRFNYEILLAFNYYVACLNVFYMIFDFLVIFYFSFDYNGITSEESRI